MLNTPSPTARRWWRFGLSTRLRCAIVVLSMVSAAFEGVLLVVVPSAVAIVALELVGDRYPSHRTQHVVLWASTALVLLTMAFALDQTLAVLPLLLVPAYRAGEMHGARAAALTTLALGAGLVGVTWQLGGSHAMETIQWWALALGLATLGAWNRRLEAERMRPGSAAAREAGHLLGRLKDLARQLPTGLDVSAVATMLIDEVSSAVGCDRAAVLVHMGDDRVTPVALSGVERVPWRDPVRSPGTPHDAWSQRKVVHDLRPADVSGRRQGSATLAVPLADRDDELIGLLVLERTTARPFSPDDVDIVVESCDRLAPHLHAALAFDELRHISEVSERDRLAREMHDGVAQDLAALGYSLDAATKRVSLVDPATATLLVAVRAEVNRTIRGIRLSISDLRSSVRPERGLGAAISSNVQSLGAQGDVAVTVTLQESPFRLPLHHEFALLRLVQDFLGDVRTRRQTTSLTVELETQPPRASLRLTRDGGGGWVPDEALVHSLQGLGGQIELTEFGGLVVATIDIGAARVVTVETPAPARNALKVLQPSWALGATRGTS